MSGRSSKPAWRDRRSVNLLGFPEPDVFEGGFYLFARTTGWRSESKVACVIAYREQALRDYRIKHSLKRRHLAAPTWRVALTNVVELGEVSG